VDRADKHDSKPEDGNEGPASKKMKHHPVVQFYEEDYDKQVGLKWLDLCMVRYVHCRFLYD
jgi:hypothetical protein